MPRTQSAPRIWLDNERGTWTILDGRKRIRTGLTDASLAEAALHRYIYAGRVFADNNPPSRRKKSAPIEPAPEGDDFVTLKEAAAIFPHGGTGILRSEIAAGRIPGYRIGSKIFTSLSSVARLSEGVMRLKRTEAGKGIYVIGYGDYIKIGITINLKRRIETLQTHVPGRLEVYAVFDGWLRDEQLLHRRFAQYRKVGEWFEKKGELAEWIDGGCQ